MAFDFAAATGNFSQSPTFNAQPVRRVTDLSPQVDGGKAPAGGHASKEGKAILNDALMLLGAMVLLLLFMGGVVFRGHNL